MLPAELFTLEGLWFLLAGVFLVGYALTDGFDLGTGVFHIFTKDEKERKLMMNSIAPVWDGNEVWLIAGGGMLFAAFPLVYAASFSGFYLAIMVVLWALIGRAVAFEYRNKKESITWRKTWDIIYWLGNFVPALLFGVAVGNAVLGVPIDVKGQYHGTFFTLLNIPSLLIGAVGLFMFMMHGAAWLLLKTEGSLFEKAKKWAFISWIGFVLLLIITDFVLLMVKPELYNNYFKYPLLLLAPAIMVFGLIYYFYQLQIKNNYEKVIWGSSLAVIGTVLTIACASFPVFIRSTIDPKYNIDIFNSASSHLTLTVMLIVTVIFLPIVIFYTSYVYKVFKGKVSEEEGYH
ncbi:MAG: cytochrome d ubiquinol oxidase subunit II [Hydrogenothermaceae bacterium]